MIIWINGAFGSGKTTTAYELHRRLEGSFVYDPENVGYFIRRNAPKSFSGGDFQDFPLWREMNYKMLKMLATEYDGAIIVPMTLVDPGYYSEIVEKLIRDGIELRHFILYAGHDEILRRLRRRSLRFIRKESFAVNSINRCIHAFDNLITEEKIYTENMTVGSIVETIGERCGLRLLPDKKTGKTLFRAKVLIKHIRLF